MAVSKEPVDLSEFMELIPPKKAHLCQVTEAQEKLELSDAAKLIAALQIEIITAGAISSWFKARGYKVSSAAVSNHRRGRCLCGR